MLASQQTQTQLPNNRPPLSSLPLLYVIVSNLQSGGNIGNILRSASIFGCHEIIVVGQQRYRLTGDHGSRFDLPRKHVWSHEDARLYLQQQEQQQQTNKEGAAGVRIYGVEIMPGASPIMRYDQETGIVHFPFDRKWQGAAFVMGNEGQGLSVKQREICDEFLFIPQTRGGTTNNGDGVAVAVARRASTWRVPQQSSCRRTRYGQDIPMRLAKEKSL
jgi:tRNA G18 (ribose-2'-O)-methylase SpoU